MNCNFNCRYFWVYNLILAFLFRFFLFEYFEYLFEFLLYVFVSMKHKTLPEILSLSNFYSEISTSLSNGLDSTA